MIERKGFATVVRALPAVMDLIPSVRACMAGEGPQRVLLQQLVRDLGVSDRVACPGKVTSQQLEELFTTCSVFVLPSIIDHNGDTEGLRVVVMEAQMCRKPVVVSEVGGIVDIVEHGQTGQRVPPGDATALAQALVRVLPDHELARRLGEEGYRHVKETFDWEVIAGKLIDVYSSFKAPPIH